MNRPTKRQIQRYNQSMLMFIIALAGLIITLLLTGCSPYKAMYHAEAEKAEAFKAEIHAIREKLTTLQNRHNLDSIKNAKTHIKTKD